ncbi:MAG: cyclodeaminase [Paracoccaceae bacterium]
MAHDILVLTEAELRALVRLDLHAVGIVEKAFAALAAGGVIMPPIMSMELPAANGEVDVKTAVLPGFDSFAIKVSTGFFDNPALGLSSLGGLMVLFSANTGMVEALLLDNGYLTDVRTAAAGAVAAKYLAPERVETAGVLGTGIQARAQIAAAHLVRPFSKVLVWGRNPENANACARDISDRLGIPAQTETDPAALVAASQLVVTATPAREPVLKAGWLHPGLHITAMGSDMEEKNEIEAAALAQADLYVADSVAQCEIRGDLRSARAAGFLTGAQVPELGRIVGAPALGRTSAGQITICDLTGTGAQDTAIATHARAVALAAGAGTVMPA